MLEESEADFPVTRWSLIDAVTNGTESEKTAAMQCIANTYWPAIYAYVRRKGNRQEKSVELTQSFFTDVMLDRGLLEQAESSRGSLRGLILKALQRYLIDQHRRSRSGPRVACCSGEALEAEDWLAQQDQTGSPEALFERRWAVALLSEALRRCESHYRHSRKETHWKAFEMRVLYPSIAMTPAPSHEEVAQMLKLESPQISIATVRVVRKRFQIVLRQVIAETIADDGEREAEFARVLEQLT